jgi:hypothetical protein
MSLGFRVSGFYVEPMNRAEIQTESCTDHLIKKRELGRIIVLAMAQNGYIKVRKVGHRHLDKYNSPVSISDQHVSNHIILKDNFQNTCHLMIKHI